MERAYNVLLAQPVDSPSSLDIAVAFNHAAEALYRELNAFYANSY